MIPHPSVKEQFKTLKSLYKKLTNSKYSKYIVDISEIDSIETCYQVYEESENDNFLTAYIVLKGVEDFGNFNLPFLTISEAGINVCGNGMYDLFLYYFEHDYESNCGFKLESINGYENLSKYLKYLYKEK